MKQTCLKIFSLLGALATATGLWSQNFTVHSTQSFSHRWLYLNGDSLLVFHKSLQRSRTSSRSPSGAGLKDEWCWLLRVRNGRVDTLLSLYAPHPEEDGPPNDDHTQTIMQEVISGDSVEYEDYRTSYEGSCNISHVGHNVFQTYNSIWLDGGGAHGSGHTQYSFWDLNTRKNILLTDFLGSEGGWALRILTKEALYKEYPGWPTETNSETDWGDPEVMNGLDILIGPGGITVQCQMYNELFDFGGIGYQHLAFDFTWGQLKPWLKKDSPVAALVNAAAKD